MDWLRDLLAIPARIRRLECQVATQEEMLDALGGRIDDLAADIRVILDEDRTKFSEAGQAAYDRLAAKVEALDATVGDQDGSDNAAVNE